MYLVLFVFNLLPKAVPFRFPMIIAYFAPSSTGLSSPLLNSAFNGPHDTMRPLQSSVFDESSEISAHSNLNRTAEYLAILASLPQQSDVFDYRLLANLIEQWTRPLPESYLRSPLIVVGPSAVGKNRMIRSLLKDYSRFFQRVVTHTTRNPRSREVNQTDYHFVTRTLFRQLQNSSVSALSSSAEVHPFFVESAEVHDNLYGVSYEAWQNITRKTKIPIFEIDIQGAITFQALAPRYNITPVFVFIAPPNISLLEERLLFRNTESSEEIQLRLRNAETELRTYGESDFFHRQIINQDFQQAVNAFYRFVRDMYPKIPSAARLRVLQRQARNIKEGRIPTSSVATSPRKIWTKKKVDADIQTQYTEMDSSTDSFEAPKTRL